MDLTQILCMVSGDGSYKKLSSVQNIPEETRVKWAPEVARIFDELNITQSQQKKWIVNLFMNGTAKVSTEQFKHHQLCRVPSFTAPYQIPPLIIEKLSDERKIKDQQLFAVGSVIYEFMTGYPPFHDRPKDEISGNFHKGIFPADVPKLRNWPVILSCWDPEASKQMMLKCK